MRTINNQKSENDDGKVLRGNTKFIRNKNAQLPQPTRIVVSISLDTHRENITSAFFENHPTIKKPTTLTNIQ